MILIDKGVYIGGTADLESKQKGIRGILNCCKEIPVDKTMTDQYLKLPFNNGHDDNNPEWLKFAKDWLEGMKKVGPALIVSNEKGFGRAVAVYAATKTTSKRKFQTIIRKILKKMRVKVLPELGFVKFLEENL